MDEDNQINQEPLEKQKLGQLEDELGNIEKKAVQEIPPQPNQPVQQPDTPQPITPVLSKDPKPQGLGRSKGILWIGVVLLVVALVGAGAYYLGSRRTVPTTNLELASTQTPTPTPDPTANWKTYTSNRAGFSLKYPTSLPIETRLCGGTCLEDLSFTPNPFAGSSSIAVVLAFKDPRIKTLDDYKNIFIKNDSSIINVQAANIGGNTAVSYKLSGGIPPLPIIEYAVIHNDYYYLIRLEDSDETNKDLIGNQKMFDQILSTFKFIEATSSATITP